MRYLSPETVRKFYRGVLKRNPTRSEISEFTLDFARNPDLQTWLSSMIYSQEFQIMVMPDLVRLATENYSNRKVFFLHVPKTAGTSVRLALTDALGIPSFNLYPRASHSPPRDLSTMEFWPYWAGHANVAAFPESHSGFTTFRESRSRILSQFRQGQSNATPGRNPHRISKDDVDAVMRENSNANHSNFNLWMEKDSQNILKWYVPNPDIQKDLLVDQTRANYRIKVGTDNSWATRVYQMGELEVAGLLEKSMKRITGAGWLHQPQGIVDAIVKVSGNEHASLPVENEFRKSELYKEEIISLESLNLLEEVRNKDRIVFKIATDLGILTDELKIDEDEIFHKSIKKLGFRLP